MTITSFLQKHGFLPSNSAVLVSQPARDSLRSLQPKPEVQPECWHWPDHVIGKRESRRLRVEHNLAMNQRAEMADGLRYLAQWIACNEFPENLHHLEMLRLIHEIENNLDIKPPMNNRGS